MSSKENSGEDGVAYTGVAKDTGTKDTISRFG